MDKITILEIKSERLVGDEALAHVRHELDLLRRATPLPLITKPEIPKMMVQLKSINEMLWDHEEHVRRMEVEGEFGEQFVMRARSIYRLNGERAHFKCAISQYLGSGIVEQKSY